MADHSMGFGEYNLSVPKCFSVGQNLWKKKTAAKPEQVSMKKLAKKAAKQLKEEEKKDEQV